MENIEMNSIQHLIKKFGGARALAKLLNKPPTTVQYWWEKGRIPAKHLQEVISCGALNDINVQPHDLFDFSSPKVKIKKPRSN